MMQCHISSDCYAQEPVCPGSRPELCICRLSEAAAQSWRCLNCCCSFNTELFTCQLWMLHTPTAYFISSNCVPCDERVLPTVQGNRSLAGACSRCRWTLWTASSSQTCPRRPAPRPRPRHQPPPASQPSRQIRPPWPRCAAFYPCRGSVALEACMKPVCSCPLFCPFTEQQKAKSDLLGLLLSSLVC